MKSIRESLQIFVRRFGLLYASSCDACCGEQVSLVQSNILFEIRRLGSPSMQRVAEELGVDVTTFSRQVKALTEKGLIVRRLSPADRRVSLLDLSAEGMRVLERIDLHVNEKMERIFSPMTTFERDCVSRSLDLVAGFMENMVEAVPKKMQQATKKGCECE
jgi:DNA-binding MarR family transcriptional regulator